MREYVVARRLGRFERRGSQVRQAEHSRFDDSESCGLKRSGDNSVWPELSLRCIRLGSQAHKGSFRKPGLSLGLVRPAVGCPHQLICPIPSGMAEGESADGLSGWVGPVTTPVSTSQACKRRFGVGTENWSHCRWIRLQVTAALLSVYTFVTDRPSRDHCKVAPFIL